MSTGVDDRISQGVPSVTSPNSNARIRSSSRAGQLATPPLYEYNKFPEYKPPSPSSTNMAQTQRSRYLKTGAIIGVLLMMLFYLSPRPSVDGFRQGRIPFAEAELVELSMTDYPCSTTTHHRSPHGKVHQTLRLVQAVDSICAHDRCR